MNPSSPNANTPPNGPRGDFAVPLTDARFHAFMDNSPALAFLVDADLRLLYANKPYREHFGITPEMIGSPVAIAAEFAEQYRTNILAALETGHTIEVIETFPMPDGSLGNALVYKFPVPDPEGGRQLVGGVAIDITAQTRDQQAVRESEARLRLAAQAAGFGTYNLDFIGSENTWSPELKAIAGLPPETTVTAEMAAQLVHPDDRTRLVMKMQHSFDPTGTGEFEDEHRFVRPDGSIRWIFAKGRTFFEGEGPERRAVRATGTAIDITARKQAEQALRNSEERFRQLAETVRLIPWRCDAVTWAFTYVGPQAVEILGYPIEEWHSPTFWADHLHPADRQAVIDGCLQTSAVRDNFELTYRMKAADGRDVWMHDLVNTVRDEGRLVALQGFMIDITERRAAEDAVRKINESLERRVAERTVHIERQAQQLRRLALELSQTEQRERRRLAETLHDTVQQIIVAAKLKTVLCAQRIESPMARDAADQIVGLLDEAIVVSRKLTAELRPPVLYEQGLGSALGWLADWMAQHYGMHITIHAEGFDGHAGPAIPEELRALLFQIVRELLLNTAKHSGTLTATVDLQLTAANNIQIDVRDAGSGFDASQIGRGTGFGLFSIRERLHSLGGTFRVDSAPGEGTHCRLIVPAEKPADHPPLVTPDATPLAAESVAPASPPKRIRVLLVDDHKMVREGLRAVLESTADIQVIGEAANGLEGVEMAEALRPDVVVMDVNMPVMNGFDATRRITETLAATRVIGLSVLDDLSTRHSMKSHGAVRMLSKDGPAETLIAAIRNGSGSTDGPD